MILTWIANINDKTENFSSSFPVKMEMFSRLLGKFDFQVFLTMEYCASDFPTKKRNNGNGYNDRRALSLTVSLFISAWLSGTIELSSMLTSIWPTASSSSNSNSFFYYFLLGFKKTPEICKIVKNYFISHILVIGIESVSTLSPHPTETGFNFLLSNHWGT